MPIPNIPNNPHSGVVRELYSRKPEWWARHTWPLVIGIAVWTAISAENIFSRWTQKVPIDSSEIPSKKIDDATALSQPPAEREQRELRPLKQRATVSLMILGFGSGLGVLFLSGRSRIVRKIHGVFHAAPVRMSGKTTPEQLIYIVVETLGTVKAGKGAVYPQEDCELIPGRDTSEMRLKVADGRSYWLGLSNVTIEGKPVPGGVLSVRDTLLKSLGQRDAGKSLGRWRSGPVTGS